MKQISLVTKLKLLAREKYPNFVNTGDFQRLAMNEGYLASNASRRLRELADAGILERRMNGRSVEYRYRQQEDASRNNIYRPEFIKEKRELLSKLI